MSTVAPDKPGAKADPLKEAALAAKLPVLSAGVLEDAGSVGAVPVAQARLCSDGLRHAVRAGDVAQHPDPRLDPVSPLAAAGSIAAPRAINWPIIMGKKETGLSIFWPDNGLDTGDILMQKTDTDPDKDTLGDGLLRPAVPDGRRGDAGIGRSGEGRQGAAHQAGSRRRPPTKAAAAPAMRMIDFGKPWRADLPADPRLQSGARCVGDDQRRQAEDLRRQHRCPRAIPKASPANWRSRRRSMPTASPWPAPTAASSSRACRPMGQKWAQENGPRPPKSKRARAFRDFFFSHTVSLRCAARTRVAPRRDQFLDR